MAIQHVEHIGIAVADAEESRQVFDRLLGQKPYKTEVVEREGVQTVFYQVGQTKLELLQATHNQSTIAKYIDKRGQGIHHIALAVDDIKHEMQRLQEQGFTLLNAEPLLGADGKLICFLHPKTTAGILVELCQDA